MGHRTPPDAPHKRPKPAAVKARRETPPTVVLPKVQLGTDLFFNPPHAAPIHLRTNYDPRFCPAILKFFSDMLEASGAKLPESEIEETRTLAEKPADKKPDPSAEGEEPRGPGRPPGSPGRPATVITEKRTSKRKEWRLVCAELPSMQKFGRAIGVSTSTIKRWRQQFPSFEEACRMAEDMASDALMQRGLRGQYDSEMVKIVATDWYNYREKHEISGVDGAPLNPPAEYRNVSSEVLEESLRELREMKQRLLAAGSAEAKP